MPTWPVLQNYWLSAQMKHTLPISDISALFACRQQSTGNLEGYKSSMESTCLRWPLMIRLENSRVESLAIKACLMLNGGMLRLTRKLGHHVPCPPFHRYIRWNHIKWRSALSYGLALHVWSARGQPYLSRSQLTQLIVDICQNTASIWMRLSQIALKLYGWIYSMPKCPFTCLFGDGQSWSCMLDGVTSASQLWLFR